MSEEFDAFDWDAANAGHILRHQVTPAEVEEAATLPHVTVPGQAVAGERRWQLFGKTAASPLCRRDIHDSAAALPHGYRLSHERSAKEDICPANRLNTRSSGRNPKKLTGTQR